MRSRDGLTCALRFCLVFRWRGRATGDIQTVGSVCPVGLLVCERKKAGKQHSTDLFSYLANHSWFFVGDVACLLALFDPEVPFRRLKATAEAN